MIAQHVILHLLSALVAIKELIIKTILVLIVVEDVLIVLKLHAFIVVHLITFNHGLLITHVIVREVHLDRVTINVKDVMTL